MSARVCVVTAGHLSTCPRMLKAADALSSAGYHVRVVSADYMPDAMTTDRAIHASRPWAWRTVAYSRGAAAASWLWSGARAKASWTRARRDPEGVSLGTAATALGRVHAELIDAVLEEPADLIYAGTIGALAAAAEAGRRAGVRHAVDFEDFHAEEHEQEGDGAVFNVLARRLMIDVARDAAFVTAGSAAIADACRTRLAIPAQAIHNVFPLPAGAPEERARAGEPFRAYWFSQTIGPGRGIEDVIRALGMLGVPAEFDLRGAAIPAFVDTLRQLAAGCASALRLSILPLLPPDEMVDAARPYDIGISAEQGRIGNRALNLANKATTYILAGVPVAITNTPGQRPLADDLGPGAIVFDAGDAATLAAGIRMLLDDPAAFAAARHASWRAARERWHWEHDSERGALLRLVAAAA